MVKQIKPCPFCGCIPEVKGDVVTHRHKDDICIVDDTQYGLEEWNKRADGWISVEDRLPEGLDHCLIYYCEDWNYDKLNKIGLAFFNSDKEFCLENSKVKPTHWMPLPEPPK